MCKLSVFSCTEYNILKFIFLESRKPSTNSSSKSVAISAIPEGRQQRSPRVGSGIHAMEIDLPDDLDVAALAEAPVLAAGPAVPKGKRKRGDNELTGAAHRQQLH